MPAFALPRHPEAFSLGAPKGKKRQREEDGKHLAFIRELPCLITGRQPVEAAHISFASAAYGKRERGKSEKADDCWTVPLCPEKHREQHEGNEIAFWSRHGIDPLQVALSLFKCTGDHEMARVILRAARDGAKREASS